MGTHIPVLDVIRAAALADPGKPAVLDSAGVTYSYGGFLAAVEISARWLRRSKDFGRITPDGKLLVERNDHARRGGPVHR